MILSSKALWQDVSKRQRKKIRWRIREARKRWLGKVLLAPVSSIVFGRDKKNPVHKRPVVVVGWDVAGAVVAPGVSCCGPDDTAIGAHPGDGSGVRRSTYFLTRFSELISDPEVLSTWEVLGDIRALREQAREANGKTIYDRCCDETLESEGARS